MDEARLARAEAVLGHRFADRTLLTTALTHPSYAAEHRDADTYDRLEFLGDAVVGFIVSEELFRLLPTAPEGELTRRKHHIVSGESLAAAAESLGIGDLVLLGKGAVAAGEHQRASVLENAVEALIGALFLDGGLEAARAFVLSTVMSTTTGTLPSIDAKSALQQRTQASMFALPRYRITEVSGPPHQRLFVAEVLAGDVLLGEGTGLSKQAAEKAAAAAALRRLDEDEREPSDRA